MSSSSVSRRGAFRQHPGCKRACTISGHPHIEDAVSGADGFGEGPVAVIAPHPGFSAALSPRDRREHIPDACPFQPASEALIGACKRPFTKSLALSVEVDSLPISSAISGFSFSFTLISSTLLGS